MIFSQNWLGCAVVDGKKGEYFPVTVPGNIQKDYGVFADFGDMNYMNNCKKYEATENWFWNYKTELKVDAKNGERTRRGSRGLC